jgi:TP901 family phage tail tape measure protein
MATSHQISFMIGASMAGSFAGTFSKAAGTLGDLQKRVSAISQNQSSIAAFTKLQSVVDKSGAMFNVAQQRAKQLGEQLKNTANPTRKMQEEFAQAYDAAYKLEQRLLTQRKELGQLSGSLSQAGVDTGNFASEQARLAQNTQKMQQAQERLQRAQGSLDASKQRISNMKGEILASAGIVMAMKAPIQQAANFEQAMARVGAVTGVTGEDFQMLSDQSRQLGRDTQFTAVQAANSQEMLARAGFKPDEIVKSMPSLLDMAAAEDMDLATGADIMASTLRGYQLAVDQSTRVADVLAKTSAASNTSIVGLGESMKYVAPIAADLKIPFEEAAAMIGIMGDAGIKGSQAGTALRSALLRLAKGPKQTEEALGKLGIATRDAQGNMRTMPSLMKALSEKMKGMGAADREGKLARIFGSEAVSGMVALMDAAESGRLNELTGELYQLWRNRH